jgi:hypothetical protein
MPATPTRADAVDTAQAKGDLAEVTICDTGEVMSTAQLRPAAMPRRFRGSA